MKFIKASSMLSVMALTAITSSMTLADDAGWYIGGNLGQSNADIDDARITSSLLDGGFTVNSIKDDDRDTGYKLFGGYQFNKNVAVEGGYFDLGEFNFKSTTIPLGTFDGSIKLRGVNLDLVGFLPFTEKFSAFGRIGVNYAEAKDSFSGTGFVNVLDRNPSERAANLKAGVGLQYAFNDSVAMRLETERYRINDAVGNKGDVDLISVGVVYRFGKKTQSVPVAAPIVVAPVVTPVAVAPPVQKFKKYTLSATELFAFNSDKVNMPQQKLVEIADALKESDSPKNIVIVGYTDRLGSDEYNQKLSERRAIAVKNYIASNGVDASRLTVEGKGEADPVVTCTDKKKADLIECLKPNRRVEIDQITVKIPVENK